MTTWSRTYKHWKIGEPVPGLRTHYGFMADAPQEFADLCRNAAQEPFVGITTDGKPRTEVWEKTPTGCSPEPIVAAATAFLDAVDQPDYRAYVQQPLDSWHRRSWFNAMPIYMPAGIMLRDLRESQKEKALQLFATCLSPSGYELLRKTMWLNDAVRDIVNMYVDSWHEWCVWLTIFGEPSVDEPWGWQLMGTHIDINCTVVGDQMSVEPLFLGAEISEIDHGPHAGLFAYREEEAAGLALGASLTDDQLEQAVLYNSVSHEHLPPELSGPVDGRHVGGAARDNRVVPYEGIAVSAFSKKQRALLDDLFEVYLARLAEGYRDQRRRQIQGHLDETYVAFIGEPAKKPFYYRVHSPTVWIEFDHHPGLMLADAIDPIEFHIHTIFRMPNGGDYGMASIADWERSQAKAG